MRYLIILGLAAVLSGCTDSFLDGSGDTSGNDGTTLTGQILLAGESSHENTYVYLTGFDISTRTDETGNFRLSIPIGGTSNQAGSYALYFYNSTFKYDSAIVQLINGQIPLPQQDLAADGSLKRNRTMAKLVELTTVMYPPVIMIKDELFREKENGIGYNVFNNRDTANMVVTARFLQGSEGISLRIPLTPQNKIAFGIVLQKNSNGVERVKNNGFSSWKDYFGGTGRTYSALFQFPITSYVPFVAPTNITKGEYYILPNLLVHQPGLPASVLSSLISCPQDRYPTADYLKLPIRYSSIGSFEVREGVVIYE